MSRNIARHRTGRDIQSTGIEQNRVPNLEVVFLQFQYVLDLHRLRIRIDRDRDAFGPPVAELQVQGYLRESEIVLDLEFNRNTGHVGGETITLGMTQSKRWRFVLGDLNLQGRQFSTPQALCISQAKLKTPLFVSLSKGAYEHWFYFPEDVDGPVFRRMQRWTPQLMRKQCAWLQNERGNYYYDSGTQTVTRCNEPVAWSNLNVLILPTDPPEMAAFLEEVQRAYGDVEFTRDPNTQLVREAVDMRFVDTMDFKTQFQYNTIDRDFFVYNWSENVPVKDRRDEMHKRGWTYVRMKGTVQGRTVVGSGRIPFTYSAYQEQPAWITFTVDDTLTISDTHQGAWTQAPSDGEVTAYPSGAFFSGLMRPWMGLHTMDLVRRDAAWSRRYFFTEEIEETGCIRVTVRDDPDEPHVKLAYTIDPSHDLLTAVTFLVDGDPAGQLEFDYLDSVTDVHDTYVEPTTDAPLDPPAQPTPGMLWLFALANGELASRN